MELCLEGPRHCLRDPHVVEKKIIIVSHQDAVKFFAEKWLCFEKQFFQESMRFIKK